MNPPRTLFVVGALLALGNSACSSARTPRPSLLNTPPPLPPPGPDEVRLQPVSLQPEGPEPEETPPGNSLQPQARRAFDGVQASLLHCYEEFLVQHPAAAGSVEVQVDLSPDGHVTRTHLDHSGESIEELGPCLVHVFRELRVRDVSPRGQYVSRMYSFHNAVLERVVPEPVSIEAPARAAAPARGRRRPGAPEPAPVAAPTLPPPPPASPGAVRALELSRALGWLPALAACAPLALRPPLRAGATGTLHFTVAGDGAVSEVRYDAAPRSAPTVVPCVVSALDGLRLRPSGITVHATVPLAYRPAAPATPTRPARPARRR